MTTVMREITTDEPQEWSQAIERCTPYDFYHLVEYHRLAEEENEGAARLFLYTEGEFTVAMPLMLRSLGDLPNLHPVASGWQDATSVYGYPGPICSHRTMPEAVAANFHSALAERLRDLKVVTAFSRLHPLLNQRIALPSSTVHAVSRTVSIDLTMPLPVQRAKYRSAFKLGINRLRRLGLKVIHDTEGVFYEDFFRIYQETMQRVAAVKQLFFSPAYFARLRQALGTRLHLFVCLHEGKPICAGLFVACGDILQYHLSGTLNDGLKLAPMKFLVDEVRLWANERGLRAFHLGGGATSDPDDSLLHFKEGFSDSTHEFSVWRLVLFPEIEERLCAKQSSWNERHHLRIINPGFFPRYRAPAAPVVALPPLADDLDERLESALIAVGETQ